MKLINFILLICFLCVGCVDQPSIIEQIGKDVKSIQNEFEKGYRVDTLKGKSLNEFINDHSRYYKIIVWGTLDGINYYCADTIYVKSKEIMIFKN